MQKLALLAALALVACGGSKKTTPPATDMAVTSVPPDLSATPQDFAMASHDFALPKGDAGSGTPTEIAAACMNICHCFTNASAAQTCDSICVSNDSRYQTSFSVTSQGKLNSFSGSFGYSQLFTSAGFFSTGSGSVSSGSFSGSGPVPTLVPTAACLSCLASATCSSLEQGSACNDVCPYLEDAD